MTIKLTDEIRQGLLDSQGTWETPQVGTCSLAGVPDVAPKASVIVWDDEHLVYWERSHGKTRSNLVENPNICVFFFSPTRQQFWKFFGTAELLHDGEVRDQVMQQTYAPELDRDPDRVGLAVMIRVDRVDGPGSVLMTRD